MGSTNDLNMLIAKLIRSHYGEASVWAEKFDPRALEVLADTLEASAIFLRRFIKSREEKRENP